MGERTVMVTGASGFVGRALCDHLENEGYRVRKVMRLGHSLRPGLDIGIEDIGVSTDWLEAVTGVDAIVHLAARVHVMRASSESALEAFRQTNVLGTDGLALQAARAGVRRFLFLSSVKVNGEASAQHPFVESDPIAPKDAYGASKAEAEARLHIIASETGMEVVILRPPLVYGPWVRANFLSLLRTVDSGVPLPFLSISNLRSLVFVGNLVDALCACLTHPAAATRTFFVSDDYDVSTPQLIQEIASALGKKARLFSFPPALLHGAGLLTRRRPHIARLTESLQVDVSSIKAALNWEPPFSLRQGLEQTVAWYRSRRR